MRRSLTITFVVTALASANLLACAPREPSADTANAMAVSDSVTAATATPLPAASDSAGLRQGGTATAAPARNTPARSAHPAPARATTDTGTPPRIKPPTKAPGGSIVLPPRMQHDSLRMLPPPVSPGTATRP